MARLSSTSSRPFGRRLRSVAVAALIVGTTGAFFSGGHAAHAMTMDTGTPPPISGSFGISVTENGVPNSRADGFSFGSSNLTVNIDGGTVVFKGTGQTASGGSNPAFNPMSAHTVVALDGSAAAAASSGELDFLSLDGVADSCLAKNVTDISLTYNGVDQTTGVGTDSLSATCTSTSGVFTNLVLTLVVTAGGSGSAAPTPELGSGELLATGLVPALGIVLYRRRRQRRAAK